MTDTYTPHTTFTYNISDVVKEAMDELARVKVSLRDSEQTAANLRQNIQENRHDWSTLNTFLNDYAEEASLCGDYETRLDTWNESFHGYALEGRYKEYDVTVRVTATYYTTVTVQAVDSDDAQEKVGDWDSSEVTRNIDWAEKDDLDYEVRGAELS